MSSSPSSSELNADHDYQEELANFIEKLSEQPEREPVVSEIAVLQSIYGDNSIRLWHPPSEQTARQARHDPDTIRYEVEVSLPSPHEDISIRVLVSLPPAYPVSSPPQLQLLSKYIGAFGADASLFGSILRTFISSNGVEFTPDSVCVFDGLQNVSERCVSWYEEHLSADKAGELLREDAKELRLQASGQNTPQHENSQNHRIQTPDEAGPLKALPDGIQFFIAEPIIDRKSSFIGRACYISDPAQVPHILSHLMSDRRIAKAAHPIINAWRCQAAVLHQDNDDDGETAAGGRLAHLLQILEVNNVLVVVTRYFGGIHLGPDRFKHINQAARNALELGGFLDAPDLKKAAGGRGRK